MMQPAIDIDVVGAIKIKDGLFIGDEFSAQDLEFVAANKVTHIINCAGRQIPNHWEPIGVKYLTFHWSDTDQQVILDTKDAVSNECFSFIEEALDKTESTLVHSIRGQSRACSVVAAFIMRKYRWSLMKTLEFLSYRRPDLEIRPSFIQQLAAYEARLARSGLGPKTTTWAEVSEAAFGLENEELVLRNTYINALLLSGQALKQQSDKKRKAANVKWVDSVKPEEKKEIATVIVDNPTVNPVVVTHKNVNSKELKSIIKVTENETVAPNFPLLAPALYTSPITTVNTKDLHERRPQENRTPVPNPREPDMAAVPITKGMVKPTGEIAELLKEDNKRNMPLSKKGNQGAIAGIKKAPKVAFANPEPKYASENPRKVNPDILASIINNNNINNIIIQNPQKVEVNAYISRAVIEPKKVDVKAKKKQQRSASANIRRESAPSPKYNKKYKDDFISPYRREARKASGAADSLKITGVSQGVPYAFGLPLDTRQQLFMAFPGVAKTQPSAIPPLNAFRAGPVRANVDNKKVVPARPEFKVEGMPKIRKPRVVNQRPASPGVIKPNSIIIGKKDIALEATYNIYVGSMKSGASTKQRYRIRSANSEKRSRDQRAKNVSGGREIGGSGKGNQ